MVRPTLIAFLAAALAAQACKQEPQKVATDNLLVLDLGGDHPSLSADLQRSAPRQPDPEIDPASRPGDPTVDDPKADSPKADDPKADDPQPEPPKPSPKPEFHVVTLAEGQTLYNLCQVHLGSGPRWQEVARLNGWSTAQAGRLRAGQSVKLPRR